MAIRMQQRRGTLSQWAAANPVLAAGEIGWESDTNKFKIGDGVNQWDDLQYFTAGSGDDGSLEDYIPLTAIGVTVAPVASPTFTGLTDFQGIVDFSDAVVIGIDALPSQTGNEGKYLTTDGTTASWQTVAAAAPHPFTMIG